MKLLESVIESVDAKLIEPQLGVNEGRVDSSFSVKMKKGSDLKLNENQLAELEHDRSLVSAKLTLSIKGSPLEEGSDQEIFTVEAAIVAVYAIDNDTFNSIDWDNLGPDANDFSMSLAAEAFPIVKIYVEDLLRRMGFNAHALPWSIRGLSIGSSTEQQA